MTGCLRLTPTDNLYVLAGIQPTELRHKRAMLSLACRAQDPYHSLHDRLRARLCGGYRKLMSRHPFVPAALELLDDFDGSGTSAAGWADHKWNLECQRRSSQLRGFIADVSSSPSGMHFPRPAWVRLNCLQTGVGLFCSAMHRQSIWLYLIRVFDGQR